MPAVFEAEWNSRNDEHKTKRPQDLRLAGVFFYSVGWLMGLEPTTTRITILASILALARPSARLLGTNGA